MRFLRQFDDGTLSLGRLEAFSDGVFAIVVTLLVLELKVPALADARSAGELAHQLAELGPKFLSWLISFVIVCKFWLNHQHLLGFARHADYGMAWLNSLFLMAQSFVPFPTAIMGEYPQNALAVSFFGAVMALNTLLFLALRARIVRRLVKPERADELEPRLSLRSFVSVCTYLAGAGAAWWDVRAAFVAYALTPLFFIVPRSRPASRASAAPRAGQPHS